MSRPVSMLVPGLIVLALFGSLGCESASDPSEDFAPADCQRVAPETGRVDVEVTINSANQRVPVTIYRGRLEDDVVVQQDTLSTPATHFALSPGVVYSVTARYVTGDDTIVALRSDYLELEYADYDGARCWWVEPVALDLRLK